MNEKKGGVLLLGSNFYKFYYNFHGKNTKNEFLAGGEKIIDADKICKIGFFLVFSDFYISWCSLNFSSANN